MVVAQMRLREDDLSRCDIGLNFYTTGPRSSARPVVAQRGFELCLRLLKLNDFVADLMVDDDVAHGLCVFWRRIRQQKTCLGSA